MQTTLFQQLPQIYEHLLPDLFKKPIPSEVYADCRDCNMCKENSMVEDHTFFSKKTKCCTFKPIVPNYLIGQILNDDTQSMKINDYVKRNHNISPLGYFPTNDDLHYYEKTILPGKFGNDDTFFCDFYSNGDCGIWKNRNAICSTYFCHYFKGFIGKEFWDEVRDYLQFIEDTIAEYCCHELGIPNDYIKANTTNFFINVRKAKWEYKKKSTLSDTDIWGKWVNKKEQYFKTCAQLIHQLSQQELKQLNPVRFNIRLTALQTSYDKMMGDSIPKKLTFNQKCKIIDFDDQHVFFYIARLIKMPRILKDVIQLFNGKRTLPQIIKLAANKYNVDIDQHYVRHLYEQEILIS